MSQSLFLSIVSLNWCIIDFFVRCRDTASSKIFILPLPHLICASGNKLGLTWFEIGMKCLGCNRLPLFTKICLSDIGGHSTFLGGLLMSPNKGGVTTRDTFCVVAERAWGGIGSVERLLNPLNSKEHRSNIFSHLWQNNQNTMKIFPRLHWKKIMYPIYMMTKSTMIILVSFQTHHLFLDWCSVLKHSYCYQCIPLQLVNSCPYRSLSFPN